MNTEEEKKQMMATDMADMGNKKPNKTWFVQRGDGKILAMEEAEAWECFNNRSTWKRRDFKLVGVSDGTTYTRVINEGKARALKLQNELEPMVKEMQDYQKAEHRLRVEEAVDMEDTTDPVNLANINKIKRLQKIIDRLDGQIIAKEKEYLAGIFKEFVGQRLRLQCDLDNAGSPDQTRFQTRRKDSGHGASEDSSDFVMSLETLPKAENKVTSKAGTELFKHVRELEQKDPLKRVVEMFECELLEVTHKTNE